MLTIIRAHRVIVDISLTAIACHTRLSPYFDFEAGKVQYVPTADRGSSRQRPAKYLIVIQTAHRLIVGIPYPKLQHRDIVLAVRPSLGRKADQSRSHRFPTGWLRSTQRLFLRLYYKVLLIVAALLAVPQANSPHRNA